MIHQLIKKFQFKVRNQTFNKSKLFDENTFYKQFIKDLNSAKEEVIINSPFISTRRICTLTRELEKLICRKIRVYVFTRDPYEHDLNMKLQAEAGIRELLLMGIHVVLTHDYDHRKIAIIDRKILWEGSLNILSQTYSQEVMRRSNSVEGTEEMYKFMKLDKYIY